MFGLVAFIAKRLAVIERGLPSVLPFLNMVTFKVEATRQQCGTITQTYLAGIAIALEDDCPQCRRKGSGRVDTLSKSDNLVAQVQCFTIAPFALGVYPLKSVFEIPWNLHCHEDRLIIEITVFQADVIFCFHVRELVHLMLHRAILLSTQALRD